MLSYFSLTLPYVVHRAPLARNYESEKSKLAVKAGSAVVHPLLPNKPKEVAPAASPKGGLTPVKGNSPKSSSVSLAPLSDPLSSFVDPLSAMTISAPIVDPLLNTSVVTPIDDPLSNSGATFKTTKVESRNQTIEVSRQTAKAIHNENLNAPWHNRKQQILKDYAISGNIFIFLCVI